MTIIVFDGNEMVGDRAAWAGSMSYPVRKVYRVDKHYLPFAKGPILVGIAGHCGFAHEALRWIREGGVKPTPPDSQKGYPSVIVVDQRRRIWKLQAEGLTGEPVHAKRATFGAPTAEAMAMGCMLMGASARTAIKMAIRYTDVGNGLGIDVVRLK